MCFGVVFRSGKDRYVAQIVSPSNPNYLVGLVDHEDVDVDFGRERHVVGVAATIGGFTLIEIDIAMSTYKVTTSSLPVLLSFFFFFFLSIFVLLFYNPLRRLKSLKFVGKYVGLQWSNCGGNVVEVAEWSGCSSVVPTQFTLHHQEQH